MINRKFMAIALPLVTFATLVGSGFAAWVFEETKVDSVSTGKFGVNVTDLDDQMGSILLTHGESDTSIGTPGDVATNLLMELDQGKETTRGEETKGISFKYSTEVTTNLTATYTISDTALKHLNESGLQATLTATLTVTHWDVYDKYIATDLGGKFTSTLGATKDNSGATDRIYTISGVVAQANTKIIFNFEDYAYKTHSGEGGKPLNATEYNAMHTAMQNLKFQLDYSVVIDSIK